MNHARPALPSRETTMAKLKRGYSSVAAFRRDQHYSVADRLDERAVDAADTPFILFEGQPISFAKADRLANRVCRDKWVRSGDLVRFDTEDYLYFVDRIGDTYRWKSENVSTEEVSAVLSKFRGPAMVNVYGVLVPGEEGRAGMVALTYEDRGAFDPVGFYHFAEQRLAHFAMPVFVRISRATAMTTTFKLRKVELQREGYDPMRCGEDPLYVADPDARAYAPLTKSALDRLGILAFEKGV